MITKTKVYATTYGAYSDWSVDKLFPTEEMARAALHDGGGVEEFEIWDNPPHKLPWHEVQFTDPVNQTRQKQIEQYNYTRDGDDDDLARWHEIRPEVVEFEFFGSHCINVEGPNASENMKLLRERIDAYTRRTATDG